MNNSDIHSQPEAGLPGATRQRDRFLLHARAMEDGKPDRLFADPVARLWAGESAIAPPDRATPGARMAAAFRGMACFRSLILDQITRDEAAAKPDLAVLEIGGAFSTRCFRVGHRSGAWTIADHPKRLDERRVLAGGMQDPAALLPFAPLAEPAWRPTLPNPSLVLAEEIFMGMNQRQAAKAIEALRTGCAGGILAAAFLSPSGEAFLSRFVPEGPGEPRLYLHKPEDCVALGLAPIRVWDASALAARIGLLETWQIREPFAWIMEANLEPVQ